MSPKNRTLRRLFCNFFMAWAALAPVVHAQTAINSGATATPTGATLPLRNLQIEVRQMQHDERQREGLEVRGSLRVDPNGQWSMPGGVAQAQSAQTRQSATAVQQVLVLNGRSAYIALRTSTPLRLMQTLVRNGVLVVTQGTVLLDAITGFTATPRWDGSDRVELELAAQQSPNGSANRPGMNTSSQTTSVLALPLGEWITVAQSEQETSDDRTALGGAARQSATLGTELQVRLMVR